MAIRFIGVEAKTNSLNGWRKRRREPIKLKQNIKRLATSILFLNIYYEIKSSTIFAEESAKGIPPPG